MKRKEIRLTESELRSIITNSVKRILQEYNGIESDSYYNILNLVEELEELNSTTCGDDNLNDMLLSMKQYVQNQIGK